MNVRIGGIRTRMTTTPRRRQGGIRQVGIVFHSLAMIAVNFDTHFHLAPMYVCSTSAKSTYEKRTTYELIVANT
jgi:hypothetical protein